jgi:putative transposase
MRSTKHCTISPQEVHGHAAGILQEHVKLRDHGHKCRLSVLFSILFFAASRRSSVHDACLRLSRAPSAEAVHDALRAILPELAELTRRLNASLAADIPAALKKRPQRLAIDLTLIPYHGRPYRDWREVYRGKPKSGTSHFHAYATCYVVRHGYRFTVAMIWVMAGETMKTVVQRLLRLASQAGVKPRLLLLDRGFYSVEVIRYLQAARYPFLMPVAHRGRPPRDPHRGTRAFARWKKGGWSTHTLHNAEQQRKATVGICVSCRNYRGQWRRHGRQTLVYAYWGFRPSSPTWVRETYRKRFGIETTYRQMNQARIRTCTRDPLLRLFYVGLALILRNAWAWFHLTIFAERFGRVLLLHLEALRFRTLLLWLQRVAETSLGCREVWKPPNPEMQTISDSTQTTSQTSNY